MLSRRILARAFSTSGTRSGNAELVQNCRELINRNPRNLERLRIARKPNGYHLEKPGRSFWHKLVIVSTPRHVTAQIEHFENGVVLSASSTELGVQKQLYRTADRSAYFNVGRLLAQRCLESGICEVYYDKETASQKANSLASQLEENGISLSEPPVYKYPSSWDKHRPAKPWESFE